MDIILTSNSPGEISGWVRPVVRELTRQWPQARIRLFLLPCSFASGQEEEIARQISGITAVYPTSAYWHLALYNRLPSDYQPDQNGLVLFLGGDQTHAVIIGKRLGFPVYVYTEGRALWPKRVRKYFVPYEPALEQVEQLAPGKGELVGNLMLDAVRPQVSSEELCNRLAVASDEFLVALFPGSRPGEFRYVAPFMAKVAEIVQEALPQVKFVVSLSPFISAELADEIFTQEINLPLIRGAQYDIMNSADLALTIPGTNTAEMAFLGLPIIVIIPLDRPELIPLEGLPGLIGRIPVLGKKIKSVAIRKLNQKTKYTALPNIIAGREVAPELRGIISPEQVGQAVISLLEDNKRRAQIGYQLKETIGTAGAAGRLVKSLYNTSNEG